MGVNSTIPCFGLATFWLIFKYFGVEMCDLLCDNYLLQWRVAFEDELSWFFTKRFRVFFILFAENSQILLKNSVIPILLTFIYLVALNLLVNKQLNSLSNSTHHCGTVVVLVGFSNFKVEASLEKVGVQYRSVDTP